MDTLNAMDVERIKSLYDHLYKEHSEGAVYFQKLLDVISKSRNERPVALKERDQQKKQKGNWFLSNEIVGMSLYVDRFAGNLQNLETKIDYFNKIGVNFLHILPIFESPPQASDGGYAVSNFKKVDDRFGSLEDLVNLQKKMTSEGMYLMLDIVINHTSSQHEWALKAKQGKKHYQDYFYFFDDRSIPDAYDKTMPEVFPESAPGNFTYVPESDKWVMTVFHNYQWDLNYRNPAVFVEMIDNIFFYANLGVDILRIDAPAFTWKQLGTTCQNLPEAHIILQLIKQCVRLSVPGMALLGEAIVAPQQIMKYFGDADDPGNECDFAYNATQMALQWDALATGDTKVMMASQEDLLKKPSAVSWINYTRCHDDIWFGFEDEKIMAVGSDPLKHRQFLKDYYTHVTDESPARGALFANNPKTNDARISGTLASLCGLEEALENKDQEAIDLSIKKILLMQAYSFFIGGIPMLYYGDELGYINDYTYQQDETKNYDNRWLHRPLINWERANKVNDTESIEARIFSGTQQLIKLRKKINAFSDHNNVSWINVGNTQLAAFRRTDNNTNVVCLFNFSNTNCDIQVKSLFNIAGRNEFNIHDHWSGNTFTISAEQPLLISPYAFIVLELT